MHVAPQWDLRRVWPGPVSTRKSTLSWSCPFGYNAETMLLTDLGLRWQTWYQEQTAGGVVSVACIKILYQRLLVINFLWGSHPSDLHFLSWQLWLCQSLGRIPFLKSPRRRLQSSSVGSRKFWDYRLECFTKGFCINDNVRHMLDQNKKVEWRNANPHPQIKPDSSWAGKIIRVA